MDRTEKLRELERLRNEVARLETELRDSPPGPWAPPNYYMSYHTLAGMVLGFVGACSSLLFNIVGSAIVDQSPFQLIRVYMTFPVGAAALEISDGMALAGGCALYLCTGALFGIPFHLLLSRWFAASGVITRFAAVTILGLALWLVNFYLLLSWMQPALIGGNWIVELIPWWVAMLTHLVFAWTMLLVDRWGSFVPYTLPATAATDNT